MIWSTTVIFIKLEVKVVLSVMMCGVENTRVLRVSLMLDATTWLHQSCNDSTSSSGVLKC